MDREKKEKKYIQSKGKETFIHRSLEDVFKINKSTMHSARYSFSQEDGKKILKGAILASIGVFVTYIAESLGKMDFGSASAAVAGCTAVIANAAHKFFSGR